MESKVYTFTEAARLLFKKNLLLYEEYNAIAYTVARGMRDGRDVYEIVETGEECKPLDTVADLEGRSFRFYKSNGAGRLSTPGVHLSIEDEHGNPMLNLVVFGALKDF